MRVRTFIMVESLPKSKQALERLGNPSGGGCRIAHPSSLQRFVHRKYTLVRIGARIPHKVVLRARKRFQCTSPLTTARGLVATDMGERHGK